MAGGVRGAATEVQNVGAVCCHRGAVVDADSKAPIVVCWAVAAGVDVGNSHACCCLTGVCCTSCSAGLGTDMAPVTALQSIFSFGTGAASTERGGVFAGDFRCFAVLVVAVVLEEGEEERRVRFAACSGSASSPCCCSSPGRRAALPFPREAGMVRVLFLRRESVSGRELTMTVRDYAFAGGVVVECNLANKELQDKRRWESESIPPSTCLVTSSPAEKEREKDAAKRKESAPSDCPCDLTDAQRFNVGESKVFAASFPIARFAGCYKERK